MRSTKLILLFILVVLAGCKQAEIPSQPLTHPLEIDGKYDDWNGPWYYFDKFQANLTVAHDSEYLYLCLKSADRQLIGQIFRNGLIVSFNSAGKRKPAISIVFPLGMQARFPLGRFNPAEGPQNQPDFEGQEQAREFPRTMQPGRAFRGRPKGFEPQAFELTELEIRLGKEESGTMYNLDQLRGLQVKLARQEQEIIYELRLPLQAQPGYTCALEFQPKKAIAVGIKIPETSFRARPEFSGDRAGGSRPPTGGLPPTGGRGGERGGGFPSGGGQGAPGGMPHTTQTASQSIWFRVRL